MIDYTKLTKAQLIAIVNAGPASGAQAERKARKAPKAKVAKPEIKRTQNVTEAFTIVQDRRASLPECEWAQGYSELAFCDAEGNPHTGALREDDALGHELIEEIKSYAKANAVGRSKMRYNRAIGAWVGRTEMFPARLRKLAGI